MVASAAALRMCNRCQPRQQQRQQHSRGAAALPLRPAAPAAAAAASGCATSLRTRVALLGSGITMRCSSTSHSS